MLNTDLRPDVSVQDVKSVLKSLTGRFCRFMIFVGSHIDVCMLRFVASIEKHSKWVKKRCTVVKRGICKIWPRFEGRSMNTGGSESPE